MDFSGPEPADFANVAALNRAFLLRLRSPSAGRDLRAHIPEPLRKAGAPPGGTVRSGTGIVALPAGSRSGPDDLARGVWREKEKVGEVWIFRMPIRQPPEN